METDAIFRPAKMVSVPIFSVFCLLIPLVCAHAAEQSSFEIPRSSTGFPVVNFSAEQLEYDRNNETIRLHGRVLISGTSTSEDLESSTWTLTTDDAFIDLKTRQAIARGSVKVADGKNVVYGDRGDFDLSTREGEIREASGGYVPWRVQAKTLRLESSRKVTCRKARFTSCNYVRPHYHFSASKLTVFPDRYLMATNAVFYLGRVPLFYTPFLYQSLRKNRRTSTSLRFGYGRRNGGYVKTNTLVRISRASYGRLYLDYFTKQGFGTGAEYNYRREPDLKGTLYGYRIHEIPTRKEKWTLLGSHWARLAENYYFQGRLHLLSEPDFNERYFRSNIFIVTPELINSAAFVRQTRKTTTRLSYSRTDTGDVLINKFSKAQETVARFNFQASPFSLAKLPFLNTFSAFADRTFHPGMPFYQESAGAAWSSFQTLRLARGVSLLPRVSLDHVYHDKVTPGGIYSGLTDLRDVFETRYSASLNMRLRTFVGNWDLAHVYRRRFKPNTLRNDLEVRDRGVEANILTVTDILRPGRKVLLRVLSGYDFRSLRGQCRSFKERVQPVVGELTWRPKPGWSVFLLDQYQLSTGNRLFIFQSDWGDPSANSVGFGMSQDSSSKNKYLFHHTLSWKPKGASWNLRGALRYEVSTEGGLEFRDVKAFEKILTINKDFHDFATQWRFRSRPGVTEFSFRVHLRISQEAREASFDVEGEKEFYPWRSTTR